MTPESTQPITEISARSLPGGKGLPAREADNFTAVCEPIVGEPRCLTINPMSLHGLLQG
jgi:hypothetical protein